MAYQGPNRKPEQNPTAGKINRTPAPTLTRNTGGTSYGQTSDTNTPSSVAPGVPQPVSILGQNLRQSSDDGQDVLGQVIAHGTSGRDDRVPADGNLQTRTVSDTAYPAAHGMRGRGLSDGSPGSVVPEKTGWNPAVPLRPVKLK
jgi:hypothetical protein